MRGSIRIQGVRQNNLKGWDLEIPVGQWISITGVSGSGKSSLAMDVLYAEGQRRYVETFSPYARQFLERMDRPKVDEIQGIPPALAIEGTHPVRTSRSTVGTMTELTDFLKLLFARAAVPYCPQCDLEVRRTTPEDLWEEAQTWPRPGPWIVTFPLSIVDRDLDELQGGLLRMGFFRLWRDGRIVNLEDWQPGQDEEAIEVVVDRVVPDANTRGRFVDSAEAGFRYGRGEMSIHFPDGTSGRWTNQWRCIQCGTVIREPSPHLFSFNSPVGACPTCRGFGRVIDIDPDLVVPDPAKSIQDGAVRPFAVRAARWEFRDLLSFCRMHGIPMDRPWRDLSRAHREAIFNGTNGYYGVRGFFRWLEEKAYKMHVRVFLSRFRAYITCSDCHGARLKPEALQWRIQGKTLPEILFMDVGSCLNLSHGLKRDFDQNPVVQLLVAEILQRLQYLKDVGLAYLTLDRASRTLSGGEVERVLLTRALGSRLVNTLFVLDEPSIGLHARDTDRLVRVIRELVNQGNTAVIVEHDPDIIRHSDQIVDLGPGAGGAGGQLVFAGPPQDIHKAEQSLTGKHLAGHTAIPIPEHRRVPQSEKVLVLRDVREHNLKGMDVRIPLGLLVCITGVSGSGKSTLLLDLLYRGVIRALGLPGERPGRFAGLEGIRWIDRVELVDQSALGRTPRSNPATYTKAWDPIRKLFAATPEARKRRWGPGTFSFNISGGRCESCKGEGFLRVEMQFLSDVLLRCPDCQGRRFKGEILEIRYGGKSIADVLQMTVEEAMTFFSDYPAVTRALGSLRRMGLGYLTLGQPISTVSGGEAQRLKLARFLTDSTGHTLFLLDEPTTGLHLEDVRVLLGVLHELVERGHSVLVVEHHLDVIKCADYLIDLGPEGGDAGGWIVTQGTPEEVAADPRSHTGRYLRSRIGHDAFSLTQTSAKVPAVAEPLPLARDGIRIVGAREHNLHDLNLEIPRDRLVAITGVSGSGKSTLAFNILFAEGQRRYLESLPAYVRQYLKVLDRPDVDLVAGIPPTVAIEQRTARAGRRSTVATLTEIYHFLRLLFARLGVQHCPRCRIPIGHGGVEETLQSIMHRFEGQEVMVLAPKVMGRKGFHRQVLDRAKRSGIQRVRVDGSVHDIGDLQELDRYREHWIDWVMVEGVTPAPEKERELRASIERGLQEGEGTIIVRDHVGKEQTYSRRRRCPGCGQGFDELDPRHFSFNSLMGACPRCEGLGSTFMGDSTRPCTSCQGSRLNPRARAVKVLDLSISEVTAMTVSEAGRYWRTASFAEAWQSISLPIMAEILARLETLLNLGLGYLTLDRSADTLSGGETQRIRLAAQIGSNLQGACYVLDEPTIGLHPRDHERLLESLHTLRDRGNTVVVVEHDETIVQQADWIVDLGPGPGREGGRLVAQGAWRDLRESSDSLTAASIADTSHRRITSRARQPREGRWIQVKGVSHNNLKSIDVAIPLGALTCVTGVSGSGKSSLVEDVLYRGLRNLLLKDRTPAGAHGTIEGWEALDRALKVDHAPIGKTPRSTPATYVKLWDEVRKLFSNLPEARSRGYAPGRFSFNVAAGRCPACQGQGIIRQEMSFLPDVYVLCEVCSGARFNRETLSVTYRGRNIGEILQMTMEEALAFFDPIPSIRRPLKVLRDLGLGYLTLGQPSPTLSGGEAQRIKLAQELSKNTRGRNLYVLDEPTTGLHLVDIQHLLDVLHRLVDRGDTVVVVEHHMDVIAAADHIIDLGPEGGEEGGKLVAQGPPTEVLRASDRSHTGRWLKRFLAAN